jgi:trehalose 6-phosphate synthase
MSRATISQVEHVMSQVEQTTSDPGRRLIFVSNRGPLEHYFDESSEIKARAAGGGVAVALAAAARGRRVSWVAGACTDADRLIAKCVRQINLGDQSTLTLVGVPDSIARAFYSSFCNPILWFIQHGLALKLTCDNVRQEAMRSWSEGYLPANRLVAEQVVREADRVGGAARVMLHDYHFYMAPHLIRRARPSLLLQHFVHIPWPDPSEWRALPSWMVREICRGLLANDSLAFQTEESASNFASTCRSYLRLDSTRSTTSHIVAGSHTTHLWFNPISVDPVELLEVCRSEECLIARASIEAAAGEKTIVRVDRLDPSKNILRGFQAFDHLLQRRPDLRGRVNFLAFLVPSRQGIPEYDEYARAVFRLVDSINQQFGTAAWTPVTVFHEQNRPQAIAGLTRYDVLLVNSIADGMNLVSKEGPLLNERNGVLCLSTTAGSFAELKGSSLRLNPLSVTETTAALEAALDLSPESRMAMAKMSREAVHSHQLADWMRHLLHDVELMAWRSGTVTPKLPSDPLASSAM